MGACHYSSGSVHCFLAHWIQALLIECSFVGEYLILILFCFCSLFNQRNQLKATSTLCTVFSNEVIPVQFIHSLGLSFIHKVKVWEKMLIHLYCLDLLYCCVNLLTVTVGSPLSPTLGKPSVLKPITK